MSRSLRQGFLGRQWDKSPASVALATAGGVGVLASLAQGNGDFIAQSGADSIYEGSPNLGLQYITSYQDGQRAMNPLRHRGQKFGGVKTAVSIVPRFFGAVDTVRNAVDGAAGSSGVLGLGVPLVAGVAAMELLDPISDVFSPVATAAGERLSEGMGLAPDPWDQTWRKGIDALVGQGAKELAQGVSRGAQQGAYSGFQAMRPTPDITPMIKSDPVLSQADREQRQLLQNSYDTLQRVAPNLSRENFVVRNFLRDVHVTGSGPDHATLSSFAQSEKAIREANSPFGKGAK